MPAPRTVGHDAPIEKWFLALYFLNAWTEWHTVLGRYLRYFGQGDERIPRAWWQIKLEASDLARRLQTDPALDESVARSWERFSEAGGRTEPDVSALCRLVIDSHSRLEWMRRAVIAGATLPGWRRSTAVAWDYDRGIKQQYERFPPELREPLLWHLRHYRHAMLDVSWLDEPRWSEADESRRTAFEHVLGRPLPPPPWVEEYLQTLPDGGPPAECIRRVLSRIARAVAEIGYESFFDDVASSEMRGGANSPLGDDAVRLIRKDTPATDLAAARIVVGVARGSAKRAYYGRPNVLAKMGETLSAATSGPAVAIVLLDSWDTAEFQREHFSTFRAHHSRGHRFLLLFVGSETSVSPIDLGSIGLQAVHLGAAANREADQAAIEPSGRLISFDLEPPSS